MHKAVPNWVLDRLRSINGLAVESGDSPDAVTVNAAGGPPISFAVRYIPVLSREHAKALVADQNGIINPPYVDGTQVLVATRQLAEATRQILRPTHLSWVERLSSYCRLIAPGLLVEVEGPIQKDVHTAAHAPARLRGKSGMLAEALLGMKRDSQISVADAAVRAGISTGLASRLLRRLTELRITERFGAGPGGFWRLTDAAALLDLWVAEERRAPTQSIGVYSWNRSVSGVYEGLARLGEAGLTWALGGTAAANLYAPTLTTYPDPTVWVPTSIDPKRAATILGGEIVDKGANIHIWQSDGDIPLRHSLPWSGTDAARDRAAGAFGDLRVVSMPRAYVEATKGSGRSAEVADNLRTNLLVQHA